MEMTTPQREHRWLERFIGEWTSETEMSMEPGKPAEKCHGTDTVRSLGGLWILAEGQGEMPGGGPVSRARAWPRPSRRWRDTVTSWNSRAMTTGC
jgi:Protein of unknown function (DUF1579)